MSPYVFFSIVIVALLVVISLGILAVIQMIKEEKDQWNK